MATATYYYYIHRPLIDTCKRSGIVTPSYSYSYDCRKMMLIKKEAVLFLYCIAIITSVHGCVQEYYELEEAVVRDTSNLDNLTLGFFPANLQPSLVVEIFYHVNGTAWSEQAFQPRPTPRGCASFTQKPSSSCR